VLSPNFFLRLCIRSDGLQVFYPTGNRMAWRIPVHSPFSTCPNGGNYLPAQAKEMGISII
jgi:hypothetical protein